jgi:hypothetical protein
VVYASKIMQHLQQEAKRLSIDWLTDAPNLTEAEIAATAQTHVTYIAQRITRFVPNLEYAQTLEKLANIGGFATWKGLANVFARGLACSAKSPREVEQAWKASLLRLLPMLVSLGSDSTLDPAQLEAMSVFYTRVARQFDLHPRRLLDQVVAKIYGATSWEQLDSQRASQPGPSYVFA